MNSAEMILLLTITGTMAACVIVVVILCLISFTQDKRLKRTAPPVERHNDDIVKRTNDLITFIKDMCATIVTYKWREFADSHIIIQSSQEQIKSLSRDCAKTVNDMIQLDQVNFNELLCTRKYIDFIIVNTTIMYIKQLLDKEINQ